MASTAICLLAGLALGQVGDEFQHDFRKGPLDDLRLTLWGTNAGQYTRLDQGLRVTLPADRWPRTPVGVMGNFRLHGDFEIVAGFEIIEVPEPPRTPGAGVSMYYQLDVEPGVHGSIAWLNGPNVGTRFTGEGVWERPGQKPRTSYNKLPTLAKSGRLRLQRQGERLGFAAAEGLEGAFEEFHHAIVGDHPLRSVRFNGTTIDQATPADVRLLDFRVRAAKIETIAAAAAAKADGSSPSGRALWLVVLLGAILTALACALLYGFARRRAKQTDAIDR